MKNPLSQLVKTNQPIEITLVKTEKHPEKPEKFKNVTVNFEFIDPTEARRILKECNVKNRPIKKTQIIDYVSEMKNGNWYPTHQGIAFDENGILQDGQHRLKAIDESDIGQWFFVFRHMPAYNSDYVDQGKNRSIADLIYFHGNKEYAKELSFIALFAMLWEKGKTGPAMSGIAPRKYGITINDINNYIETNKKLMLEVINIAKPLLEEKNLLRFQHLAGLLFLFGKYISKDKAFEFANKFKTIIGLTENHPILHLNNILVKNLSHRGKKYYNKVKVAMVVKAWNSFIKGEINVPIARIRDHHTHPVQMIRDENGKSVIIKEDENE